MENIEYSVRERITTVYDVNEYRQDEDGHCSYRTIGCMHTDPMARSICALLTAQLPPDRCYLATDDTDAKWRFTSAIDKMKGSTE